MSGIQQMLLGAGGAAAGPVNMGDIANSVRFRAATNGSMARTFAAPTIQNTFTWSAWVKRGGLGTLQYLFSCAANGVRFTTADSIELFVNNAIAFIKIGAILVFIGILGGLKLFGILGIVYGPLIITVFLTLAEIYRLEYK